MAKQRGLPPHKLRDQRAAMFKPTVCCATCAKWRPAKQHQCECGDWKVIGYNIGSTPVARQILGKRRK
jgi:hypothetical protein